MPHDASLTVENTMEHSADFLMATPIDGRDPERHFRAILHAWSGSDQPEEKAAMTRSGISGWRHAPGTRPNQPG